MWYSNWDCSHTSLECHQRAESSKPWSMCIWCIWFMYWPIWAGCMSSHHPMPLTGEYPSKLGPDWGSNVSSCGRLYAGTFYRNRLDDWAHGFVIAGLCSGHTVPKQRPLPGHQWRHRKDDEASNSALRPLLHAVLCLRLLAMDSPHEHGLNWRMIDSGRIRLGLLATISSMAFHQTDEHDENAIHLSIGGIQLSCYWAFNSRLDSTRFRQRRSGHFQGNERTGPHHRSAKKCDAVQPIAQSSSKYPNVPTGVHPWLPALFCLNIGQTFSVLKPPSIRGSTQLHMHRERYSPPRPQRGRMLLCAISPENAN